MHKSIVYRKTKGVRAVDSGMAAVCGNPDGLLLGLSPAGELYTAQGAAAFLPVDFNGLYQGYYPPCRFTAVAFCDGAYCAAGTGPQGETMLYRSLLGGVWEPANLVMQTPTGAVRRPMGPCVAILHHGASGQLLLVCQNGQLVTLPDCPKCVSIRSISAEPLLAAALEGEELVAATISGRQLRLPVAGAVQYRVSRGFTAALLQGGGVLADVRNADDHEENGLPQSVCLPLQALEQGLAAYAQSTPLVFYCENGAKADQAARYARQQGYSKAYSMGGLLPNTYLD